MGDDGKYDLRITAERFEAFPAVTELEITTIYSQEFVPAPSLDFLPFHRLTKLFLNICDGENMVEDLLEPDVTSKMTSLVTLEIAVCYNGGAIEPHRDGTVCFPPSFFFNISPPALIGFYQLKNLKTLKVNCKRFTVANKMWLPPNIKSLTLTHEWFPVFTNKEPLESLEKLVLDESNRGTLLWLDTPNLRSVEFLSSDGNDYTIRKPFFDAMPRLTSLKTLDCHIDVPSFESTHFPELQTLDVKNTGCADISFKLSLRNAPKLNTYIRKMF